MTVATRTLHQEGVIGRIVNYSIPIEVLEKYSDKYGVSLETAHEHERELKRYLAMCVANPEESYGMKGVIDEIWHTFILFTREYAEFCQAVVGHFVHHAPATRADKQQVIAGNAPNTYLKMLEDYSSFWGEEPPAHLWPRLSGGEKTSAECGKGACGTPAGSCSAGNCGPACGANK